MFRRRILRDRRGNASIIFALMTVPFILVAGGGVDMMAQERERARAQAALDAGIIAAAGLKQTLPAATIVPQYFAAAGVTGYSIQVTDDHKLNSRVVTATATKEVPTAFLRIFKLNTLRVAVTGRAEEAVKNMELSLVLDLSGSMRLEGRIDAMKPAAKSFIDKVLTTDTKDFTSVNLIPFAGQTNVGATMFNSLVGSSYAKKRHDLSYNFDYRDTTYADSNGNINIAIPDFSTIDQVQYFGTQYPVTGYEYAQNPDDGTSIVYLSNDATMLKNRIDSLKMYDGTGTQIAMKWAYHLLDGDFKPKLKNARASDPSLYPNAFTDRPAAFDEPTTIKFIVLMTDGAVYPQSRPTDKTTPTFVDKKPATGAIQTEAAAFKLLSEVCTGAKAKGVTIFTIGFGTEVAKTATIQNALLNCASSPTKYYLASTSDISKVFDDIARTISPLRLTN
ncbi:TadE/TadG family type IV pilus assembly protein [Methylopila sp. M107]|uniref:TadE/TadG family type IV pilus assembly protein n=1 Tax=Methylopila sp. M107 TaxID=1101190 RepID=UPI0003713B61|nr:TadE/TadG family type IV pilus assembly protein [Methylopila sp. M107]